MNGPIPGVMFGITHQLDGALIVKEPRLLKVGIGLPKGPAIAVHIAKDGRWIVTTGSRESDRKSAAYKTRAEAEEAFWRLLPSVPVANFPRKLPFFTFSRPAIVDGREQFVPDFDAIAAGGAMPTEIEIVLLDDEPFSGMYQMWSATELKCKGDGVSALRVLSMATAEEKPLAEECARMGDRYFPLTGCWTGGCPYSKPGRDSQNRETPSPCKPGGDFRFQLACDIRVGGTAYFHTTGFRSISGIFSSLYRIRTLTGGRLCGVPLKMLLRPFRSNHNGQPATHYAVSLEFRAPDPVTLSKRLMESVWRYTPEKPVRMIEAAATEEVEEIEDESPLGAAAMVAEFYPETEVGDGKPAMQSATEAKTAALGATLAAKVEDIAKSAARTPKRTAPAAPATPSSSIQGKEPTQPTEAQGEAPVMSGVVSTEGVTETGASGPATELDDLF